MCRAARLPQSGTRCVVVSILFCAHLYNSDVLSFSWCEADCDGVEYCETVLCKDFCYQSALVVGWNGLLCSSASSRPWPWPCLLYVYLHLHCNSVLELYIDVSWSFVVQPQSGNQSYIAQSLGGSDRVLIVC
jgi:hypothetical protein